MREAWRVAISYYRQRIMFERGSADIATIEVLKLAENACAAAWLGKVIA